MLGVVLRAAPALALFLAVTTPFVSAATTSAIDVPVLPATPVMLSLGYDFVYRRPAEEPTEVAVAQDGSALDVAFTVTQAETVTQSQTTNGSNVTADDYVGVYLWPRGTSSFAYAFFANPRGTRYQTSSENSAYAPQWSANGHTTAKGYEVTLRIPFDLLRSDGSTSWKAQFVRSTAATGGLAVWTFSPNSANPNDVTTAGVLSGVAESTATARALPRVQVYALGEATSAVHGGSTSRVGADVSLPISPTASFVASLHPDYSNVELDQQTIEPSPYAYQYNEVRPFFTQVGQAFNQSTGCSNCPQLLYTPAIPTFQQAYGAEGTQGPLSFAAFDALGAGRTDQAETVNYLLQDQARTFNFALQNQAVNTVGGLHDYTEAYATSYTWTQQHWGVFSMGGIDRGSDVSAPDQGNYTQSGIFYQTPTQYLNVAYQSLGAQFNPVDGYVPQTDITGWSAYGSDTVNYSPNGGLQNLNATANYSEYRNHFGQFDQYLLAATLNLNFKNLMAIELAGEAQDIAAATGQLLPFDSNSILLGYKVRTATPDYVQFAMGPYYHGRLDSWTYNLSEPIGKRVSLTLFANKNDYMPYVAAEPRSLEWLERAGFSLQLDNESSIDIGARRIIGIAAPNAIALPDFSYVDATNLTVAYHLLTAKNELYLVYGDANSLYTTPAFYIKWIHYVGASKGT